MPSAETRDAPIPSAPIAVEGASLKGSSAAKVAMVVYSDFQCPYCAKFTTDVLPALDKKYVQTGEVLLAFRRFPLIAIHPYAEKAAEATVCAGRQGKFWEMHDFFFRDQSVLKEQRGVDQAGAAVGLDMPRYSECLAGPAATAVQRDKATGKDPQVTGTPTFFLGSVEPDHA